MPEEENDDLLPEFAMANLSEHSEGWGPCEEPAQYEGILFAPFNKNDRLGRVSDWTVPNVRGGGQSTRGFGAARSRFQQQFGMGLGAFSYKHEDDENSFSLVDSRPKPKTRFRNKGVFRPNWVNRGRGGQQNWRGGPNNRNQNFRGNNNWNNNKWGGYRDNKEPVIKDASVLITDDWVKMETLEFSDLDRAKVNPPEDAENLVECGTLPPYHAAFDRVSPKNPKNLVRFETRQHFSVTTSEDPVIARLAQSSAGTVYATDVICGVLMTAARSLASWDLIVRKDNGCLFFDKRPGSKIDFLTVNEHGNDLQQIEKDSVNNPWSLSQEATSINQHFTQHAVDAGSDQGIKFPDANPFLAGLDKGLEAAAGAFRYRRFVLDDIKLVCRTHLDGCVLRNDKKLLLSLRALNEFDSKLSGSVDWRQKLDTQPGAVFAQEMKNNSAKLARWTAESMLSGAQEFRLGFVSRRNPKDNAKHEVLLAKRWEPQAFAQQMAVRNSNLWGVFKTIVNLCQQQQNGLYLILKDPNKPQLHLYKIPEDTFDEDEAGDEM